MAACFECGLVGMDFGIESIRIGKRFSIQFDKIEASPLRSSS